PGQRTHEAIGRGRRRVGHRKVRSICWKDRRIDHLEHSCQSQGDFHFLGSDQPLLRPSSKEHSCMARLQGLSSLRPLWQGAFSFGESERAMSDASASCEIVRPKLHHFGLTTANLEAMLNWYGKVLGMTSNHQTSKPMGSKGP